VRAAPLARYVPPVAPRTAGRTWRLTPCTTPAITTLRWPLSRDRALVIDTEQTLRPPGKVRMPGAGLRSPASTPPGFPNEATIPRFTAEPNPSLSQPVSGCNSLTSEFLPFGEDWAF
jgi:hypothetical protein